MKFGSHRGFAFVEFVTKQEAQNALQALASTHLYGRHLVTDQTFPLRTNLPYTAVQCDEICILTFLRLHSGDRAS